MGMTMPERAMPQHTHKANAPCFCGRARRTWALVRRSGTCCSRPWCAPAFGYIVTSLLPSLLPASCFRQLASEQFAPQPSTKPRRERPFVLEPPLACVYGARTGGVVGPVCVSRGLDLGTMELNRALRADGSDLKAKEDDRFAFSAGRSQA